MCVNQQPSGDPVVVPPSQPNGVMVDLLHPQEVPATAPAAEATAATASTPIAPAVPPKPVMNVAPITPNVPTIPSLPPLPSAPAPSAPLAPVAAAPVVPPTGPVQIGTTQQPRLRKPFPTKIVAIIVGLLVVLGAGGGAAFFFLQPKPEPVAETPVQVEAGPITNLSQATSSAVIAAGGVVNQTTIGLKFDFQTSANRGTVVPEIEVAPVGTAFTNEPTKSGDPIEATGKTLSLTVPATDQKDGNYHWQARIKVGEQVGEWTAFSADTISYGIDTVAPTAPTVTTVDTKKVTGSAVTITSVRPVFSGTSEAGSTVDLTVKPEGLSYTATTGADGKWTITPTADIPNGEHTVAVSTKDGAGNAANTEFALSVNPVANTAPQATPSPDASPVPTPTPTNTPEPTLAPTGDPVAPVALGAFLALAASTLGLWRLSRRYER